MITTNKIAGIALGAAMAFGAVTSAAQAAPIYATAVDFFEAGTGVTDPDRMVESNALGSPDGAFLSLGLGGTLIVSFGQLFTGPLTAIEVTFGNRGNHVERVEVYAGLAGVWTQLLGTLTNSTGIDKLEFAGVFDQLKLVDVSESQRGRDGFDVDSISVTPVPLPAAGLLLLGALGAAAALRRRKTA